MNCSKEFNQMIQLGPVGLPKTDTSKSNLVLCLVLYYRKIVRGTEMHLVGFPPLVKKN